MSNTEVSNSEEEENFTFIPYDTGIYVGRSSTGNIIFKREI